MSEVQQLARTMLGSTGLEITRIGVRRVGDRRRRVGVRLGAAGRRGVDRGDPPRARAGRQLDRHCRRVRIRALRGGRRPGARRASSGGRSCSPSARCSRGPAARSCTTSSAIRFVARRRRAWRGSGVEAIDLYQIHWPNPDEDIEEGWSALKELKDEGLVRHIGVSNFDVEQMRRIQRIAPIETLQPQYSLIERDAERGGAAVRRARGHRRDRVLADGLGHAHRAR